MGDSLARLLKIRNLLEDSSRLELEHRVALSARIARAQEQEKEILKQIRQKALAIAVDERGSEEERAYHRAMEWADAESTAARRRQLRTLAEVADSQVIEARGTFLERRTARRQAESVVSAAMARLKIDGERRAQRDLDDWFNLKQARRRRGSLREKPRS